MLFEIIFFIIVFTVAYLFFSYIFNDMLKKEKYTKITELKFLTNHFKLDKKKCNYKELLNGCAIINAFIIGFTVALVDYINIYFVFKLSLAVIIIVVLLISLYMIYGKYLNKKWGNKDGI
jgi:hypothetical protein